jgi:AmmeMemoRadiSam system protein B
MSDYIRHSVIAGTWYPFEPRRLESTIDNYFKEVKPKKIDAEIIALISPHAGYDYSGQVAAYGYNQIIGKKYDVVVIVSPVHRMLYGKYVTNHASYYETPLGRIPLDKELINKLSKKIELTEVEFENEHSVEIQLPFLQVALKEFRLLPIMVGHGDVYDVENIVNNLVHILKDENALLIASTDLHHIDNYEEVIKKDNIFIKTLSDFKLEEIRKNLAVSDSTVCGKVPVSIVVDIAQRTGANNIHILTHSNSGDITGERQQGKYTVGYLSAAIVKES